MRPDTQFQEEPLDVPDESRFQVALMGILGEGEEIEVIGVLQ